VCAGIWFDRLKQTIGLADYCLIRQNPMVTLFLIRWLALIGWPSTCCHATLPWFISVSLGGREDRRSVVNQKEALAFVERRGIVLQAARGPVPNLAEAIAGGPIRGSWWGHPKGKEIFRAAEAICKSPNVLVCKLIGGKITYVHRRLWPALVKLASRLREEQFAKVWNEHTASGAHQ